MNTKEILEDFIQKHTKDIEVHISTQQSVF